MRLFYFLSVLFWSKTFSLSVPFSVFEQCGCDSNVLYILTSWISQFVVFVLWFQRLPRDILTLEYHINALKYESISSILNIKIPWQNHLILSLYKVTTFFVILCKREGEDGEKNPVCAIQRITDANGKSPQD